jgi:hypothetical protein
MLKHLRDPIWQFIGATVGIATLFVTIALANPALVGRWWQPVLIGALALIGLAAVLCSRGGRQTSADRVWRGWLEDLSRIERNAHLLSDRLSEYPSPETQDPTAQQLYRQLADQKGVFRRHKDLWGAINDFLNRAGIVIADWQTWDSRRERDEAIGDMLDHYGKLLEEIEKLRRANLDGRPGP